MLRRMNSMGISCKNKNIPLNRQSQVNFEHHRQRTQNIVQLKLRHSRDAKGTRRRRRRIPQKHRPRQFQRTLDRAPPNTSVLSRRLGALCGPRGEKKKNAHPRDCTRISLQRARAQVPNTKKKKSQQRRRKSRGL